MQSDRTAAAGTRTCSFRAATSSAPGRPGLAQLHGAQGTLRSEEAHHHRQRSAVHPGGRCAHHPGQRPGAHRAQRQDGPADSTRGHGQLRQQVPHVVHNATVDIKASATTAPSATTTMWTDRQEVFPVSMPEVGVDTSYQTYARGRIREDEGFQLSPAFDYFGDVLLQASTKELTFSGNTRILHDCPGINRNWMASPGPSTPRRSSFPWRLAVDAEGFPIGAGIFLTSDDPFKYLRHLPQPHAAKADKPVLGQRAAVLRQVNKAYLISNKDKIRQRDLPGNLLSLSVDHLLRITADGRISTGTELGQVKRRCLRHAWSSATTAPAPKAMVSRVPRLLLPRQRAWRR
jgi:hypothetical protein